MTTSEATSTYPRDTRSAERGGLRPVSRRTVVAGAAWAVPAVAFMTVTPAFAASQTSTVSLEFERSTYSGSGCVPITGARVRAFVDGVVTPATTISVSLSQGYSFAGGSASYASATGSDGWMALPDISTPAAGGSGTMSAASGSAVRVASVLTSGAAGLVQNGSLVSQSSLPKGSIPVSGSVFLTPDGRILRGSTVYATGVASAGRVGAGNAVPVKKLDGTYAVLDLDDSSVTVTSAVAAGSSLVEGDFFLTSSGDLMDATGRVYVSNVAAYGVSMSGIVSTDSGTWSLPIRLGDGSCGTMVRYSGNGPTGRPFYSASTKIPSGSTPIVDGYFHTPAGDLVNGGGNAVVTGLASVGHPLYPQNSTEIFPAIRADGTAVRILYNFWNGTQTWSTSAMTGVAPSSTPLVGTLFLQPDGRIVNGVDGSVLVSGVASIGNIVGQYVASYAFPFAYASC